ncbi:MAG: glycosyltransferase [Microscillaceae bacterium]|nr:glycosyltransferase [Microscillaceae bacterium]MDW8459985.1 glycosyltransferase [Cytophagales bacterium]
MVSFVQICIWGVWFSKLAFYKLPAPTPFREMLPVSVVIAAHNEYANLSQFLEHILAQNYPIFEVIIANDRSTDKTSEWIETWQRKASYLREIRIEQTPQGFQPKKYALTQAIQQAQYPIVLLTDADCLPASSEWIKHMVQHFDSTTEIVLGFSPYQIKAGWLNKIIQFETLYTAIQYLSFALWGLPYMGVGRNVAYRKYLFDQAKAFEKHKHIVGGDDDLFINQKAHAQNTKICLSPQSFVYSLPKTTWKTWIIQKKRHLSVGKYYKPLHLWLLGIIQSSYLLFWLLFFPILFFALTTYSAKKPLLLCTILGLFLLRNSIFLLICRKITRLLHSQLRYLDLIILDTIFVFVWFYLAIWANISKKTNWA